jgi:hypothetical protein
MRVTITPQDGQHLPFLIYPNATQIVPSLTPHYLTIPRQWEHKHKAAYRRTLGLLYEFFSTVNEEEAQSRLGAMGFPSQDS